MHTLFYSHPQTPVRRNRSKQQQKYLNTIVTGTQGFFYECRIRAGYVTNIPLHSLSNVVRPVSFLRISLATGGQPGTYGLFCLNPAVQLPTQSVFSGRSVWPFPIAISKLSWPGK